VTSEKFKCVPPSVLDRDCAMPRKTTISIIKCDVGSLAGHHIVPKPLFDVVERNLKKPLKRA
jgi:hypothetical protein